MFEYAYASSFSVSILVMSDIFLYKKEPFPNFLHHLVDKPQKLNLFIMFEWKKLLKIVYQLKKKKHKIIIRIWKKFNLFSKHIFFSISKNGQCNYFFQSKIKIHLEALDQFPLLHFTFCFANTSQIYWTSESEASKQSDGWNKFSFARISFI